MSTKQQSKPAPNAVRRDELFTLSRDLLLTAISAAGGAPRDEQQARELVRLARAVQSEVDTATPRITAKATVTPHADLDELSGEL